MSSVATFPLTLVFAGTGPSPAVLHLGTNLRTVEQVREAIDSMTIAERAVLVAICKTVVAADGGRP